MGENAFPAFPAAHQDHPNVLLFEGDIDLHVSPAVTESLNAVIRKKPEVVVIDTSRVTFIDSAGVAALILAMQDIFPDVDAALAASGAFVFAPKRINAV
jgi:anti-sigma B factor antagonist